jgi:cbb3-type cytochrome oxidase subunit 3
MKRALLFLLKFAIAAPICLVVGWWLSPAHIWLVGQLAGGILSLTGVTIQSLVVEEGGVLNTKSMLVFITPERRAALPLVPVLTTLPSYLALVLATGGMTWKRKAGVCAFGAAIIFASHILYVVLLFHFAGFLREWEEIPLLFILFPFLLWIVFAYWPQVQQFFAEEEVIEEADSQSPHDT